MRLQALEEREGHREAAKHAARYPIDDQEVRGSFADAETEDS